MVDNETVRYIAGLARINLTDKELEPLAKDLSTVLDYIAQLETLNVSDIKPTSHVLAQENVFRPDEIKPSLSNDEALSIAVSKAAGSFKVPRIIESND